MRAAMLAVVIAVGAGCGKRAEPGGGDGKKEEVTKREEKAPVAGTVEVAVLNDLYKTNEAAAEEKYTNRRMTCLGYVHSVTKSNEGYVVQFVNPNFETAIETRAFFPAAQASKLTKLEKYSPLQFKALCTGRDKSGWPAAVALRECEFVPLKD
jgi:hypothetical protein